MPNKIIVLTGPTASGKSALAVELAKRLNTEIISADSRQIYKGIPIVTAVPSMEEREGIRHYLLEELELDSYYSASKFEEDAMHLLSDILKRHGSAIVCGGSMMYIDALCNGIDELPTVPSKIRNSLMDEWKMEGNDWLLKRLLESDPLYYRIVDKNNLKRVFHAVEITLTAGKPYSELIGKEKKERPFDILKICLDGNRERLFERINNRVLDMVAKGLEEEARSVFNLRHLNSLNTVGLKEMFTWFDGGFASRDEAIARIQKNTRVYAKKQMTWYKKDPRVVRLDFERKREDNAEKILSLYY
ncbi:MAG: tRNA (adenosine(37)-N6)-dimethylallyltransferase MiaA [Muribaculaceae bacterium]|nr:tRNA (adenosine(37)-N6)-dimethylallyltransferase MiaA [Muribaculaceae bacterium]